ncbi:unnamed protein product [Aspergillus oryzae]|uniref:Unnamed protein product n=2 Tax=Aspergillus oryzae TaxID=5062 RepID=A0AAN5BX42_ASPOZ|nr:unnamed protein product [Aspergillus oryzae]GMF96480.1 unnamed protein product [Aspergillus oryzae]GMG15484.1 unnamed protein product [Aspergillus oryzae]GMG37194.1 unnamed protein product [Aspergillus oryzae]GMG52865.1 unnamed protein product [Aspergillus oryzae var. brunneus]
MGPSGQICPKHGRSYRSYVIVWNPVGDSLWRITGVVDRDGIKWTKKLSRSFDAKKSVCNEDGVQAKN